MNSNDYQIRINQALAYLNQHLHQKIKINELARQANFSVFHFQRIYKLLQGETPYETILRLRLEKAVSMLKFSTDSIQYIAFACGFDSPENFSRQFKSRFKMAPSAFQKNPALQNSRIYQEAHPEDFYLRIEESRKMERVPFSITIEEFDGLPIAFIRAIFGADGSIVVQRYEELMAWARQKNLRTQGERCRFGMSVDNPDVTPVGKYRYDFAIAVPQGTQGEGLIEIGEIPAGTYATIHCIGKLEDVAVAWDQLYRDWLFNSDYAPLDYPCLEEFIKGPEEIGWENFNIKCRIPVKKRK